MSWSSILWLPKLVLAVVIFFAAAYLVVAFNYSYSDGNRAGYMQRLSKKGWICKTYEGELAMTTVPGVAPVLWQFTVVNDKVAAQLDQVMGKPLILHYKEYRYIPTTCFGETTYFVDKVEVQE